MRPGDTSDTFNARGVTAAEAAEILDQYGENAMGRPRDERALIMFSKDVLSKAQAHHADAVRRAEAEMEERAADIAEAFDAADAAVRSASRDLVAGRTDAKTARRRLAKVDKDRQALAARIEQLRRDDDAATALAEQSPVEWQAQMLAKYPAMRRGLPSLSRQALREHE